jgi:hypothetical protein
LNSALNVARRLLQEDIQKSGDIAWYSISQGTCGLRSLGW